MNSQHVPPIIGTVGMLGSFTIGELNELVGIAVGLTTLVYLAVRIAKEINNKK
tara:strand:+ start:899 stop:1057 length:159 start_codon:yes stop_codon:yes gene_type:complete